MDDINMEDFVEMDSSDQDEIIDGLFINMLQLYQKRQSVKRKRRWRVRPTNMDWSITGYHRKTFLKIKEEVDEKQLFVHTRMSKEMYDELLKLTARSLTKYKEQIHADERLSITLLYLANGDPIQKIAQSHKLGKSTVRITILETCEALWEILSPIYLSEPTEDEYKRISDDFARLWDIPNCVGAVDARHVSVTCPPKVKALHFSLVLFAACDAKYTFTALSVGSYMNQSDKGVFHVTKLGQDIAENRLPLPSNIPLPSTSEPFPHYFVGDCEFPLKENLMTPYAEVHSNRTQNVFNYRLSKASRVIENAFGILTARWKVMKTTMEFSPENAEKIIRACFVLHNFIMCNDRKRWYCPENYVDTEEEYFLVRGEWRNELETIGGPLLSATTDIRGGEDSAYSEREQLANYFLNVGAVPYQSHIT